MNSATIFGQAMIAEDFTPDYAATERISSEIINIWQRFGTEDETVTVRINKVVADNFKCRAILPRQQIIKEYENGDIELNFRVTNDLEFKQLIMPWFPEFKIIKPAKYKKLVDDMVERYRTDSCR